VICGMTPPTLTGRAVIGAGVMLCFTPCHHQPVRLEEREAPADSPDVVQCRRCQRCYTLTFPPVGAGEPHVANWRAIDG